MRRHPPLLAQILAVLSRRTPAFQPTPEQPHTFGGALRQAWDSRPRPRGTSAASYRGDAPVPILPRRYYPQDYDDFAEDRVDELLLAASASVPNPEELLEKTFDRTGDPQEHQQMLDVSVHALNLDRLDGNKEAIAVSLNLVGKCAVRVGDYEQARAAWQEALELYRELDYDEDDINLMRLQLEHLDAHSDDHPPNSTESEE